MYGSFTIMPEDNFFSQLQQLWWQEHDLGLNMNVGENALYPNRQQYAEWSQQMVSTMYQNWWNSEEQRMQRMMAAGINPYAAAQGIAGVGGSTGSVASSPNSSVGKGAEALGTLGNAAANLISAGGSSFANIAQGVSMLSKLRGEIDKIDSETKLNFENLGFTSLQSRALSTQLKYMDYKERMSCYQALANYNNTTAQYDILKQEHLNKIAELDKILAETDLTYSLDEKAQAEAAKIEEERRWQKAENDFWEQQGYLRGSPIYEALRDASVNGKPIDIDAFGDLVAGYEGKVYFARENAAAQASWNRRPTTSYDAAAYVGASLGKRLKDLFSTNNAADAMSKVDSEAELKDEFDIAYDEARDELKATYRELRKEYIKAKYSGANSMYVAELERRKKNAKEELDSFTREKFGEQISGIATQKEAIKNL